MQWIKPWADQPQQIVARIVAQRVIDLLEVIQVEHHRGETATVSLHGPDRLP